MASVERSITIDSPIERVYKVISNFKDYPKFLPEIKDVKIIKKGKAVVEAAFKIDLLTTGGYTLKFILKPPSQIRWSLVKGDNMKSNEGSWRLSAIGETRTKAVYSINIEFGWLVPRQIASMLIESHLPKMLKNFKDRSEKGDK